MEIYRQQRAEAIGFGKGAFPLTASKFVICERKELPKAKAKLSALALSLVEAYKAKRALAALKPPFKKIAGVGAEPGSHAYGSGRKRRVG